ncbi:MAG: RdgB/HAM1 family non-canonical purine NTP pyrophosphatase [Anaerolineales bacterium]|nr:RdgB/HAM1 family non-canonical purine NTP pyrophosphatase [Anaerolineales bacterium]
MIEKSRLLIATTNPGKQREYRALLRDVPAEIVFPDELGIMLEVEEDGATFRENAVKKARALMRASGLISLADDSGLEVDALGGEPGVRSARYAGPGADDPKRRAFLLGKLLGVPAPRRARFVCVIAIAAPDGAVEYAEGECRGEITFGERGTNGFGYDPIFQLEGRAVTMAEIPPGEKNELSHRARAARAAVPILRDLYSGRGKT